MSSVLQRNRPTDAETLRRSIIGVSPSSTPHLTSLVSGPKDEWDRKMKEDYEAGGALKTLVEKGREDYQTGNTSPLP